MALVFLSMPFPGVTRVGEEGAKLGLWEFVQIGTGQRVAIPRAEHYILGAWHPMYTSLLDALGGRITVLWTSSTGEVGFEPQEAVTLKYVLDEPRVSGVWFGHEAFIGLHPKGFYAPYPFWYPGQLPVMAFGQREKAIALFAPGTAKKNLFNQLYAVQMVQQVEGMHDLVFYTNIPVPPVLTLKAVASSWVERDVLNAILARCRVALCVSWAESFSYFTAEALSLGTPVLGSPAVSWAPNKLVVHNPNDPRAIYGRLMWLLGMEDDDYYALQVECSVCLLRMANDNNSYLKEHLIKCLER